MAEKMTGDVTPYDKTIKTDHPDGELHLYAEYPYWHNEGCWQASIEVLYRGHRVGTSGIAKSSRDEAIAWLEAKGEQYKASFDPAKRISPDHLNWWNE